MDANIKTNTPTTKFLDSEVTSLFSRRGKFMRVVAVCSPSTVRLKTPRRLQIVEPVDAIRDIA